jgi:predicted CoA-binding protein
MIPGMTPLETIRDFLAQKRIAVVGVSRKEKDFNRTVFRDLRKRGYDVVPVNPKASEIDGAPCYGSVHEIMPPVDAALLMTPAGASAAAVRDCVRAGVKRVWLYKAAGAGAVSAEAVDLCEKSGVSLVPGRCPYMFLTPAPFPHNIHGGLLKLFGKWPK